MKSDEEAKGISSFSVVICKLQQTKIAKAGLSPELFVKRVYKRAELDNIGNQLQPAYRL